MHVPQIQNQTEFRRFCAPRHRSNIASPYSTTKLDSFIAGGGRIQRIPFGISVLTEELTLSQKQTQEKGKRGGRLGGQARGRNLAV